MLILLLYQILLYLARSRQEEANRKKGMRVCWGGAEQGEEKG